MRMKIRSATMVFGLVTSFLAVQGTASADVIVQNTGGAAGIQTEFFGESFTTPVGGPWTGIAFNFYSNIPATIPTAAGTAFLLSQAYLGTPSALGTGTPGFLAASTSITGGKYIFDSSVTLQANTMYFLYENAALATSGGNTLAGAAAYFAGTSNTDFATATVGGIPQVANFSLTGQAVPEPSSLALCGLGLAGTIGYVARRRPRSWLPDHAELL
jgi:hypothetical protein